MIDWKIFIAYVMIAALFSCTHTVVSKTEEPSVQEEGTDNCSYYENGQLAYIVPYTRSGEAIWYYPNGQVQSKLTFKNHQRHGVCEWYYESGQLKEINNYEYGNPLGPFIRFYENGQLEYYIFFNEERSETAQYGKVYSQDGSFKADFGSLFSLINIEEDKEKHWMTRIQPIEIISAIPPHTTVNFVVHLRKGGEEDYVAGQRKRLEHDWRFTLSQYFPSKGMYDMMVIAECRDTMLHTSKQDTALIKNIWVE